MSERITQAMREAADDIMVRCDNCESFWYPGGMKWDERKGLFVCFLCLPLEFQDAHNPDAICLTEVLPLVFGAVKATP